jgi:hypothetical protein
MGIGMVVNAAAQIASSDREGKLVPRRCKHIVNARTAPSPAWKPVTV